MVYANKPLVQVTLHRHQFGDLVKYCMVTTSLRSTQDWARVSNGTEMRRRLVAFPATHELVCPRTKNNLNIRVRLTRTTNGVLYSTENHREWRRNALLSKAKLQPTSSPGLDAIRYEVYELHCKVSAPDHNAPLIAVKFASVGAKIFPWRFGMNNDPCLG